MHRSIWLRAKDPFSILRLSHSVTKAEIKTRYRELARLHHRDAGAGNIDKMEEINRAYNLLLKEGAYERLQMKSQGLKRRPDMGRPNPFSKEQEPQEKNQNQKFSSEDFLSDEEIDKVSALDPATERVTPSGKYMYQNRDDNSWVELNRPLVHAHQPRYASFAAQAEMSAELRRRSFEKEKEKEENAKSTF